VSATGRNLVGSERRVDDDYATPAWCTRAIAPYLTLSEGMVLDPCCGAGGILDVFQEMWPRRLTKGIEIDHGRADKAERAHRLVLRGDALTQDWPSADVIVTNPPYNLALEFIEKALHYEEVLHHEPIDKAFLLRLNFLGAQKRASFHKAHPCDVYVLPRRPSFTGGGTDATEYAFFVWGPKRGNRWFMLDVEAAR
jgi:hypothetical protein